MSKEKRPYRVRSAEFKAEAVRMVESGERQTEVARKLGISPSMLGAWVAAARGNPVVRKQASSESERNKALERELKQARMELDILKKALGYFAKENK